MEVLRFIISNSELYRFQISNKFYDPFIKLLLRTYNNLFDNLVVIDEDKLANSLDSTKENISKILYKLEKLEVLDYQEKNKLEKIKFLQARIDLKVSHFNENKWIERKSIDDSCGVYLGDEFLGLVYLEEDEGEIAYQFHMTILGEDLLEI